VSRRTPILVLILAALCLSGSGRADDVHGEPPLWQTDFEAARLLAAEQGRPLYVAFSRSGSVQACITMEKEVWRNKAFIRYAKEHFVLVWVDFPLSGISTKQQRANDALRERFGIGNWPTVMIMTPEPKVVKQLVDFDDTLTGSQHVAALDALLKDVNVQQAVPVAEERAADDGFRIWTDVKGRTVSARLLRMEGDGIVVELRSGKSVTIPLEKLSNRDLDYLNGK